MKICLEIQAAVAQRAGVGRYTRELAAHLAKIAGNDQLSFFYFDFMRRGLSFPLPQAHGARWCPGRLAQFCWKKLNWPPFDRLAGRADLYHFTNFIIPPLTRGKKVVTIYDASFLRHPAYTESRNLAYLRARIDATVARADAIITISRFSADELAAFFPEARNKIHVIYPGVLEPAIRPPAERRADILKSPGIRKPYILTVGTLEPRKNIPFLIEVFEKMKDFDGTLVIAGRLGWKYSSILESLRTSARAKDIRVIQDATDEELAAIYYQAELFIYPSFYEGFGFPPLEALACGVPVISSAGGSLPEVLGAGAVIIEQYDAGQWAEAARALINDKSRRQARIDQGRQQAARYTWAETARQTMALYRSCA